MNISGLSGMSYLTFTDKKNDKIKNSLLELSKVYKKK